MANTRNSNKTISYNRIVEADLNHLFSDCIQHENQKKLAEIDEQSAPIEQEIDTFASEKSEISNSDILSLIELMSGNIAYLTEKVKNLKEQITDISKSSVLKFNVDRDKTKEEDLPLLKKVTFFNFQ